MQNIDEKILKVTYMLYFFISHKAPYTEQSSSLLNRYNAERFLLSDSDQSRKYVRIATEASTKERKINKK